MVKFFSYSRQSKTEKISSEALPKMDSIQKKKKIPFDLKKKRFQSTEKKIKAIKISIVSKMDNLQLLPYSFSDDNIGSFFFDEMERTNTSENSPIWRAFYFKISPKSQNLPLVILNQKEIFENLFELVLEDSITIFILKLLFALIRDVRELCFDHFVSNGLDQIALIMTKSELIFEQVLIVIGAFVRHSFKKICSHLDLFFDKLFKICFEKTNSKQIVRVYAELIAFLYKRSNDVSVQTNIIMFMLEKISGIEIIDSNLKERNVIYFISCFFYEFFKGFQEKLDEGFKKGLKNFMEAFEKVIGRKKSNEVQFFDKIIQKGFRVLNFKFMKSELKFNMQNIKSDFCNRFFDLIKELLDYKSIVFQSVDICTDLLIDRLLYKDSITFGNDYLLLSNLILEKILNKPEKKTLLINCLITKIDQKDLLNFLSNLKNIKDVKMFLEEALFGNFIDVQNESLAEEKYILVLDKKTQYVNFNHVLIKCLFDKINEKNEEIKKTNEDYFYDCYLILDFISKTNGFCDIAFNFESHISNKFLKLFDLNFDLSKIHGFTNILKKISPDHFSSFIDSNVSFFVELSNKLSVKLSFLMIDNFEISLLDKKQIEFFIDPSSDMEMSLSLEVYLNLASIFHQFSTNEIKKSKNLKSLSILQKKFKNEILVHSRFISFLFTSNIKIEHNLIEVANKLSFCMLTKNNINRDSFLSLFLNSNEIDFNYQEKTFIGYLRMVY